VKRGGTAGRGTCGGEAVAGDGSGLDPLAVPLRRLQGVGPVRERALADAGLHRGADLLGTVPRWLDDAPAVPPGGALPPGEEVRLDAEVVAISRPARFRGRSVLNVKVAGGGRDYRLRFFNAAWIGKRFEVGRRYRITGRADAKSGDTLNHPSFIELGPEEDGPEGPRLRYPDLPGAGADFLAGLVARLLDEPTARWRDPLGECGPARLRGLYASLHRPRQRDEQERARRELARRACRDLAWRMRWRRRELVDRRGRGWDWSDAVLERGRSRLPFALTPGQEAALVEVRADLRASLPMYRLLQGEVGSGKTALAFLAAHAVIAGGGQVCYLAPTTVLADQVHAFLAARFAGDGIATAKITAAVPRARRDADRAALADGRTVLAVGTHALFTEGLAVPRLGLVIVDEQQRFGVEERAAVMAKGGRKAAPDLLAMTATPIPRTLALTRFGDLAISRIAGRPPGRAPVTTRVAAFDLDAIADEIRAAVAGGGGAYVIAPRREAAAAADPLAAESLHRELARMLSGIGTGILHGGMAEAEKLAAIGDFAAGRTDVLVATSVVEVGIDVPRANLLAVLEAEHFGLAQLHQLRGRIGRGALPGTCLLCTRDGCEHERLRILCEEDDGLAIAEADLAQRGPGAIAGTRQHGAPAGGLIDPLRDADLLEAAHHAVAAAIAAGESPPPHLYFEDAPPGG